jgi:prolyl-tRNA editing enzyme YbaK/EbsC (Cys-tRNA(Pro) deacylase)
MKLGTLQFEPAKEHPGLVAAPTATALAGDLRVEVYVAPIDQNLSDTATFCSHYQVPLELAANCILLEASRGDRRWFAVCMVPGSARADVNGVIRKHLDARRVSFAPMGVAVRETGMEYGGITPIGLPKEWPILIDRSITEREMVIVGSGIRGSKLALSGSTLTSLPNATVLDLVLQKP